MNVKNQDTVTKILDMVPELIDKVGDYVKEYKEGKVDSELESEEQELLED